MTKSIGVGLIKKEVVLTTARSSGPGGQNVNKVETKVIIRFNVRDSQILDAEQKETLLQFYERQLTKEGELIVSSEAHRSQLKNKELAFKKLDRLLTRPFIIAKPRKATKPSKSAVRKRLTSKKLQGEKKRMRQKPE